MSDHYGDYYYGGLQQQSNQNTQKQSKVGTLYGVARLRFIQKVYTILSIQLAMTALMIVISMNSQSFFRFQIENTWLMYVSFITIITIQIYFFCCNGTKSYPQNMILLGLFTLGQGYLVSFICSMYAITDGKNIVILAAVMTAIIVITCTIYAFTTTTDFTTNTGIILVLSVALFILFFVTLFTSSPFLHNLYCAIGVILFGIYLIFDTQLIMGGKKHQLTVDQYILAAMYLYLDIIQIFLYILQLLSKKK